MPDLDTPMTSLPSRPLTVEQDIDQLKDSERFEALIYDDHMTEVKEPYLHVYNCIFITEETVSAVVYSEDDDTWYRIYSEPRSRAVLTDAYDAVRDFRDEEILFDRHSLTIAEAVFMKDRPSDEETSDYEEGDSFDCPVCGDPHVVKFDEDELMKDHPTDTSKLYVECPEASNNELTIEYQASTPS